MSADLVVFLRARLDEDTEAAEAARQQIAERTGGLASAAERLDGAGRWAVRPWLFSGRVEPSLGTSSQTERIEIAKIANDHIARHDPARVLADIEAKRGLIDGLLAEKHAVVEDCWYTCAAATEDRDGGETCRDGMAGEPCDCGRDARVERLLRLLALRYDGHPDFKERWRT